MNVNRTRVLLMKTKKMLESQIFAGAIEKLPGCEKSHANTIAWSYDTEGHAKKCVESIANWHTNQLSNCRRSPHHVLTTIGSKRMNWKRLESRQKRDQTSCGRYTNWHELSQNGQEPVTIAWLV